jgi:lipid-binding SYLF domain-containing protein
MLLSVFSGNAVAEPPVEQQREELRIMAESALADLYARQPEAEEVVRRAAGYAVFSSFGAKFGVAGTGKGKGLAINNKTGHVTYMKVLEAQAGLGFGIKKYRLIWVFDTQSAFDEFVTKGRQIGGQATLNARASGKGKGAAGAASVDQGVWLYQLTDDGLAAEITLKGSQYFRDKDLN